MTETLPNELLLKLLNFVLCENGYKYLWKIRRTCKKWSVLIPVVINDHIYNRFENDLKFEIRMEFAHQSIHFNSKFEMFENTCKFRLTKLNDSTSSTTGEDLIGNNNLSINQGETCCAIHLEMFVKQSRTSLPFGWRTKEYIPTILLPGENPCDIKQAKFGMGMILGYKLSPCTDNLAEDVFKLRVNNKNNSEDRNRVRVSGVEERGRETISSSSSTSTLGDDTTIHTCVAPCTGVELIYLNIPREVLLELMDALDHLAGRERPGRKYPSAGKIYKLEKYEDVTGNPYQRRSLLDLF